MLTCPKDGGRLSPIMGQPRGTRPGGRLQSAPVLTGYRCSKGHTLTIDELEVESPE